MAKRLFEQPYLTLTVGGSTYDVSADVSNLEIITGRRAPVDVTGLSDTYDQYLVPNYRGFGIKLSYFNNMTGSSAATPGVTDVLRMIYQSTATTGVLLTVSATTAVASATNHKYSGYVQLDGDFAPMAGGIAEADKGSVSFKGLGNLTWQATSS